jgi:hypothetical protein
MDSPRGRPGRTPVSVKPIAAALAVALMGMGGVALAAPKADSTAPDQGNGPAPQAQANGPAPAQGNAPAAQSQDGGSAAKGNGPAPRAHNPAPPPHAKAKGHQSAGKPAEVPPAQPPQVGGGDTTPGGGQAGSNGRHRGRPAPGETRGQGRSLSGRGNCQSAACRGAVPKPDAGASSEQPLPVGGQQDPTGDAAPGGSEGPPHRDRAGSDPGEHELGAPETETGSVLGANQGGGQEVEADTRSFDTALPFTGFEVVLLAGIGALLWLVGVRLRRSTA